MIFENELRQMRPLIRYQDKTGTTLPIIGQEIYEAAVHYGIPIAFYYDIVRYGGLFDSGTDDCLVVYHPYHYNDYFKVAIRIKYQGTYAFVSVEDFGRSTLLGYERNKQAIKRTWADKSSGDLAMVGAIFTTVSSNIMATGKRNDLEEERQWYTIISDIIDEVICVK